MPDENKDEQKKEETKQNVAPQAKGDGGADASDIDMYKDLDGKEVTINYGGQQITYKLIADWTQWISEVDIAGRGMEAATQGLKQHTIKGIIGTMSLVMHLGHTSTAITSLVRSESDGSQHQLGTAFDIVDKSGDDSWYQSFWDNIAVYSDDFCYATQNSGVGAWHTGVAHEGTGWHVHADNYLGGLCGESEEEKAQMRADNARNGGDGGAGVNGGSGRAANRVGDSPRTHSFSEKIKSKDIVEIEIKPRGKTYCEPVYPDYLYVTGNIPNSSIEKSIMGSKDGLKAANGDTALMTAEGMQDLTGLKMNAFTTDHAQAMAQRAFDPTTSIMEVKVPSAGKPLNNNDPYPVDLKIEELENHLPRVKQYKLNAYTECPVSKDIVKAILTLSDYTEKRLVKLENILATMMRYTFGMGSRMFVNCQYYGGQDTASKGIGKCIRCLRDDRCGDGQVMQIDQCLSCSRYEPIIGQRYDILSEVGANLAAIQDDIQMGYMNMEDYIDWVRIEKMHNNRKDVDLAYQTTKERSKSEQDFADIWDEGVKMGWKLTPVEQQKAQINWRQDINSQDKSPQKLSSFQQNNGPGATALNPTSTVTPGKEEVKAKNTQTDMDAIANGDKNSEDPGEKPNESQGGSGENQPGQGQDDGGQAEFALRVAKDKLRGLKAEYDKVMDESRNNDAFIKQYHDKWLSEMKCDPELKEQKSFSLDDIRAYGCTNHQNEWQAYRAACNDASKYGDKIIDLINQMRAIEDEYKIDRYNL